MMSVKPQTVVRFLEIIGKLTSTWPLDSNSVSIGKIIRKIWWIISVLNVIGLLVPLALGVYHHHHHEEPILMMKALSELTALGDVFFNLILCKLKNNQLHSLLSELLHYVDSVNDDEKLVFHKNINHYFPFWAFVGLSYFQTAVAFSCGPFFMIQILPADTWYPFTIETFTTKYYAIYIQQVVAILQTGMCITVDFMVAILLCYSSTKLEILNIELERVKNINELNQCIRKHQSYIGFSEQLAESVKYIILKSNATMAMTAIFGAIPILSHQPLPVTSQFILMVVGGCMRLYVSAWPADNVCEMSEKIASSIYTSSWMSKSSKMKKSILIMIYRAQKPITISVKGILPSLTLKYYASFLSTTLSYFMTLHAVLED